MNCSSLTNPIERHLAFSIDGSIKCYIYVKNREIMTFTNGTNERVQISDTQTIIGNILVANNGINLATSGGVALT
jgi:predicted sulfurtransferase